MIAHALVILTLHPFGLLAPPPAQAAGAAAGKPFRVMIDPGHGGVDYGTIYDDGKARVSEKQITLLLAREVARELKSRKIAVSLTRAGDVDLPLSRRTALANQLGADLFLSIHMNSSPYPDPTAQGIETYILNNTTDATSRRLAELENAVLSPREKSNETQADVALILKDLKLDANLAESKRLACAIQDSLITAGREKRSTTQRDRGVKQAMFYVLLGAEMPSVLVEAGFLSHPKDRALVLSSAGRRSIAHAIAQAIVEFRRLKDTPEALSALSRCKVH